MKSMVTKSGTEIKCLTNNNLKACVIISENRGYIVDTGSSNMRRRIMAQVDQMKKSGLNFEAIVLTHSHADHAANVNHLKKTFKIPVFAHSIESDFIERGQSAPIIGTTTLTRGISKIMSRLPMMVNYPPCDVDFKLNQSETEIGRGIRVIHTAGHTGGSLSVCIDKEVALVGDALFGTSKTSIMPAFIQDKQAVFESWKRLSDMNCRIYVPSHGRIIMKEEIDLALDCINKGIDYSNR